MPIFWKCCRTNLPCRNLILGEWGWKHAVQQIFPAHKTLYLPQLLKTNLLSETIVTQAQTAFVCSNSAIITAE